MIGGAGDGFGGLPGPRHEGKGGSATGAGVGIGLGGGDGSTEPSLARDETARSGDALLGLRRRGEGVLGARLGRTEYGIVVAGGRGRGPASRPRWCDRETTGCCQAEGSRIRHSGCAAGVATSPAHSG